MVKKTNKNVWYSFIGLVVSGFFFIELKSIFDTNPNTITLTSTIINNISPNIFFPVIGALFLWVIYHFIKYYPKVSKWKL